MSRKPPSNKYDFSAHFSPKDEDIPATQGMLQLVRFELKDEMSAGFERMEARFSDQEAKLTAQIGELRAQTGAGFAQVNAQFADVTAQFSEVKAQVADVKRELASMSARFTRELHEVRKDIHNLKADMQEVLSIVKGIKLDSEEQNSKNRIVLDSHTSLWQRQERVEERIDTVEHTLRVTRVPR